ncbi:TPA: hypothetical protein ACH3X3_006732 [Trebouxia sp. C0006]
MITICFQRMALCSSVRRWSVPSRLLKFTPKPATSLLGQTPNKRVCHATKTACSATSLSSLADGSIVKQERSPRNSKRRLDEACLEQSPSTARNVVQSWIVQGKVLVNGKVVTKPGTPVSSQAKIDILAVEQQYVCRAGHKMEAALEQFGIDVTAMTCLDAGLSTGGFTDCLLQKGAVKVYGVDVGFGQVAERLRTDSRVVVIDRTNLRYLKLQDLPGDAVPVDLISLDLSFISVLKVMPAVCEMLRPGGVLIVLVKPQFEAGRDKVASGGVVRDPKVHKAVIETVCSGIAALGFTSEGHIESPIKGASSGNKEFLAWFQKL